MTKIALVFLGVLAILIVCGLQGAVQAQGEPPPPYAGLKNPFPWDSASAQEEGKKLYQQSCLGCHGATGSGVAAANFSSASFAQDLESKPDLYFWISSEGRLSKGMPPFKSSLSADQLWQVLTYLGTLGKQVSPKESPTPTQPATGGAVSLQVSTPNEAQSGEVVTLTATLRDSQAKPIVGATVDFFVKVDFFASGLVAIGEAVTSDQGIAVLQYAFRESGNVQVVTRFQDTETTTELSLADAARPFYQAKAGIRLPTVGGEVFIGSKPALGEMGNAPKSIFRLPGSILSWLLLVVGAVILVWTTYFRVMYQIFRIPLVKDIRDTDTRVVPKLGLAVIVALGSLLVFMLLHGPYTHFNLLQ